MLTGRRAERLNALCAELSKQTEVLGLVVDVRDRKAMEEAIANLPPSFATLRGLINNAGLAVGTDPAPKCSCGMCTCSRFYPAAPRHSMRRCGRFSSQNWWARRTCRTQIGRASCRERV